MTHDPAAREQAKAAWTQAIREVQEYRRTHPHGLARRVRDWWVDGPGAELELALGAALCKLLGHKPAEDLNAPRGIPVLDAILPETEEWHCPRCCEALPKPAASSTGT